MARGRPWRYHERHHHQFCGIPDGHRHIDRQCPGALVGGQQFSVDNLCVKHDGTIVTATGPVCPDQCEGGSDFDALPFGEKYGDLPSGATTFVAIGDVAFDADDSSRCMN